MNWICNISVVHDPGFPGGEITGFFHGIDTAAEAISGVAMLEIEGMIGVPDAGDMKNLMMQVEFVSKEACMKWCTAVLAPAVAAFNGTHNPEALAVATIMKKTSRSGGEV